MYCLKFGEPPNPAPEPPAQNIQFVVTVHDLTDNSPIALVRISLVRNGIFISGKVSDPEGRALFRDVRPGTNKINFHVVGYNDFSDSIHIDAAHTTYTAAMRIKKWESNNCDCRSGHNHILD